MGEQKENLRHFWLATNPAWGTWKLGLASASSTLDPGFANSPIDRNLWFIGFDTSVAIMRIAGQIDLREYDWSSAFFAFVSASQHGPLLTIMETTVVSFDWEGKELWHRQTDILIDWRIQNGMLALKDLEEATMRLDPGTGQEWRDADNRRSLSE